MSYFVCTALGFITGKQYSEEFPKECVDQGRSRDIRWAVPFSTWNEANAFATQVTTCRNWPSKSRYYAIVTSASPNLQESPPAQHEAPEAPRNPSFGTRLKAILGHA